ncbi:MAG: hypothetical protein HQL72_06135 [Magnetococcales bacterium]|nr:hypothetical protein [Magnetococcales bacterium]
MINRLNFFFVVLIILATSQLSGCGYRFPGDPALRSQAWAGVTLIIEGPGQSDYPLLARILKDKLVDRLGISSQPQAEGEEGPVLRIEMESPVQEKILESRDGRVYQYSVTIKARPKLSGQKVNRLYPQVQGESTFYIHRSSLSTSNSSRAEALESLSERLAAVLSAGF